MFKRQVTQWPHFSSKWTTLGSKNKNKLKNKKKQERSPFVRRDYLREFGVLVTVLFFVLLRTNSWCCPHSPYPARLPTFLSRV